MRKTVDTFAALGAELGVKPQVRKPQTEWAEKQQEKFLKCPKCGNRMTYMPGTNIVTCNNEVGKEGATHICGYNRMLDEDSVSYANYIFS